MDNNHRFRRWGLNWIVIGFLVLVQVVFNLNGSWWLILGVLLISLLMPERKPSTSWGQTVLGNTGYLLIFIIVMIGLLYASSMLHLNTGLFLALISLTIGIVMQVWTEITWDAQRAGATPTARIIERIRRL
jgi:hypothetical protein